MRWLTLTDDHDPDAVFSMPVPQIASTTQYALPVCVDGNEIDITLWVTIREHDEVQP